MRLGAKAGGASISRCLISLHHLPFFLFCCPFGSPLAGPVRSTSVWEEASGFQLQWCGHGTYLSQCRAALPAACCCVTSGQRHGGQLGTASHQRPWSFTHLRLNILSLETAEARTAVLLSAMAEKEKCGTFFPHFTSMIAVLLPIVSPTARTEPPSS